MTLHTLIHCTKTEVGGGHMLELCNAGGGPAVAAENGVSDRVK